MDEWLKREKPIDLQLKARLRRHEYGREYSGYEDGARDFLDLLRRVESLPCCNLGWYMAGFRLWEQEEEYLRDSMQVRLSQDYADESGSIYICDDAERVYGKEQVFYSLKYRWGLYGTRFFAEFRRFRPEYDLTAQHMIALLDAVTRWKRPQHIECGPFRYLRDHHPLDRSRSGIRWIGWVPFALNPSDVPEAELVQPMNGGSLIATQLAFWQAFERHPYYSKEAIERAQEVEIRLNLLGVLPTTLELDRGDWGAG